MNKLVFYTFEWGCSFPPIATPFDQWAKVAHTHVDNRPIQTLLQGGIEKKQTLTPALKRKTFLRLRQEYIILVGCHDGDDRAREHDSKMIDQFEFQGWPHIRKGEARIIMWESN